MKTKSCIIWIRFLLIRFLLLHFWPKLLGLKLCSWFPMAPLWYATHQIRTREGHCSKRTDVSTTYAWGGGGGAGNEDRSLLSGAVPGFSGESTDYQGNPLLLFSKDKKISLPEHEVHSTFCKHFGNIHFQILNRYVYINPTKISIFGSWIPFYV